MDENNMIKHLEDKIMVMVEGIKARRHVLFPGLNGWLTNTARHTARERATGAANEVGQRDRTVVDIKNKRADEGQKNK